MLNRPTLPWERLVDGKSEDIPFLALLIFNEDEELNGDVKPPISITLEELGYPLEPGEKPTDKVNVIDVKPSLLYLIMPTGEELRLLAHGRESAIDDSEKHQRAVVIAKRLPASKKRNIAHLVMLENRYNIKLENGDITGQFNFAAEKLDPIRLVCLKSWQFTCSVDKPTLKGRLLSDTFTFEPLCVPKTNKDDHDQFEPIRTMSYAALPYHLRWGDRTHTLYHGPLVAAAINDYPNKNAVDELSTADKKVAAAVEEREKVIDKQIPASADGLVRLLQDQRIFDVSLAAAWQLGQLLMLRDQSVAMEYFRWRRGDAQLRARDWNEDGHLHHGDDIRIGLTDMPATVIDWCQKRLELHGLPFEYLIPDTRMLPENSLRIFRIHEGWMECLIGGALSVGRAGKEDRILEVNYHAIAFPNQFRDRTGFLLRSPAVEEHRDLKVTASNVTQVRLERIAPGLLLGIYAGTFTKLEFSLPPIGLHFGLAEEDKSGFVKYIKDETTGKDITRVVVDISKDVVDISKLSKDIAKVLNLNSNDKLTPGRFAFQMCEGTESVEFSINHLG